MKQTTHICARCGAVFARGKKTSLGTVCPACAKELDDMNMHFSELKSD